MQKSNLITAIVCAMAVVGALWFPLPAMVVFTVVVALKVSEWAFGPSKIHTAIETNVPEEKRDLFGTALVSGLVGLGLTWWLGWVLALIGTVILFFVIQRVQNRRDVKPSDTARGASQN